MGLAGRVPLAVLGFWVLLLAGCQAGSATAGNGAVKPKATYVIVHGAWGGGWAFRQVDALMTADGYKVYRPTLTGQGERVHLASRQVNLSTHIQDVVNVILYEDLHDVILVGHSYGGMVVTGVADRVPERIKKVVYLDAFVPEDGESADMLTKQSPRPIPLVAKDGFYDPNWLKPNAPLPHDVPMTAAAFAEPIALKNPAARALPGAYILTVDPGKPAEGDTFYPSYVRAQKRKWPVWILMADHNPQWSKPQELVQFLERAGK